jgi:hypothetical protein
MAGNCHFDYEGEDLDGCEEPEGFGDEVDFSEYFVIETPEVAEHDEFSAPDEVDDADNQVPDQVVETIKESGAGPEREPKPPGECRDLMKNFSGDLYKLISNYDSQECEIMPLGLGAIYCIQTMVELGDFEQAARFDELAAKITRGRPAGVGKK